MLESTKVLNLVTPTKQKCFTFQSVNVIERNLKNAGIAGQRLLSSNGSPSCIVQGRTHATLQIVADLNSGASLLF